MIEFSKFRFKINHSHKIQPCNTQLYEIINIQIYIHKYTQRETHNNLRLHIFRFFWETWSYYWRLSSQFFIRFYKLTTFPLVPPIDSLVLVKPALSLGIKSKKKKKKKKKNERRRIKRVAYSVALVTSRHLENCNVTTLVKNVRINI